MEALRSPDSGDWINQESVQEVKKFDEFTTIDWVEDDLSEHRKRLWKSQTSTSFKSKTIASVQTWFVLALMGVSVGLIAGSLNIITAWLYSVKSGYCTLNFYLNESFCCWGEKDDHCSRWKSWSTHLLLNYLLYLLISLLFSSLAAVLVKVYAPSAAGSGISEIKCIVSGFSFKGFLGWWTLLIKSIGLPLAISSGLSLGKEGPSVHYAVCVGNSIAGLFESYKKSSSKAREFLTATSAAGVAVAFGSPMGGVLFSIEEISSAFHLSTIWKSYVCSLIAVTTLASMNPFRTGQLVLFEVTYDKDWHYFEIPIYILLGVFGGLYGIVVSKLNKKVVAFRKRYLTNLAVREVFILTLLTGTICYFNSFLRLDMTESMQILFHECDDTFKHELCNPNLKKKALVVSLVFATIARMFFTITTYGCKVPAGIFVPSMAAGATFGRALGILFENFYSAHKDSSLFSTCPADGTKCVIPGTYAFLGAGAALSGITHLTVTVVIIMFELTGALRYIIPTMIVVAVTKSINDRFGEGGIADQMIKFNGLPFLDANEEHEFNTTVSAAMTVKTVALPFDGSLAMSDLREITTEKPYHGYPVIESLHHPRVIGYISRDKVVENIDVFDAFEYFPINRSPIIVHVDTKLEYVLDIFVKLGPRHILVQENGLLAGLITRKDILRYEHTTHAIEHPRSNSSEQVEEKVWNLMLYTRDSVVKTMGKLFHNNEYHYL